MTGRKVKLSKAEEDCPYFHDHTPAPQGYMQWHVWAQRMGRTHKQVKCSGCGLYAIWLPRRTDIAAGDAE